MGGMYHITMLVSGEQEDAIRSLFRDKNWPCWIKALSNEHLDVLKQGGFSDMFSSMDSSESHNNNSFREIKTEVIDEDDNELSDNQSLNESEHTPTSEYIHSNQNVNASGYTSSNSVEDTDDTMNDDIADNKADVFKAIKEASTDNNAIANNKQTDNGDKIVAPNPAYLMIYPYGHSQLVGTKGQPVTGLIQPMGTIMQPMGSLIQPMGSLIQPMGNMMPQWSGVAQQSGNNSQRARRSRKPVRYDTKPDSETDSDTGMECSICGAHFTVQSELNTHFKQAHTGLLGHGCKDCMATFRTLDELWDHRRTVHRPKRVPIPPLPEIKKPSNDQLKKMGYLECPLCNNMFRNKKSLRKHFLRKHKGETSWTCDVCNAVYTCYQEYCQHIKAMDHQTSKSMLGSYMCDFCGKILKRFSSFQEHKRICNFNGKTEEEKKTVPCDECGVLFKTFMQVKDHKRNVHVVDPVTCEICGDVMKNKRALFSHRFRHNPKNKKFPCDECDKSFLSNSVLKQHKRTHTKEKPFKCPMCDYRCAAKANLNKHSNNVHKIPAAHAVSASDTLSTTLESIPMIKTNKHRLGVANTQALTSSDFGVQKTLTPASSVSSEFAELSIPVNSMPMDTMM